VAPPEGLTPPHLKGAELVGGDEGSSDLGAQSKSSQTKVEEAAVLWLQRAADREQDAVLAVELHKRQADLPHLSARGRNVPLRDAVAVWEDEIRPLARRLNECRTTSLFCDLFVRELPSSGGSSNNSSGGDAAEHGHHAALAPPQYTGTLRLTSCWEAKPMYDAPLPPQPTLSRLLRAVSSAVEEVIGTVEASDVVLDGAARRCTGNVRRLVKAVQWLSSRIFVNPCARCVALVMIASSMN